jgi:peptide-methionine (S)-S-oxide reductase
VNSRGFIAAIGILVLVFSLVSIFAWIQAPEYEEPEGCGDQPRNRSEILAEAGESATLGGGCFWCMEAVFERVEGVVDVRSGYSGGEAIDASYRRVCTGNTGHAEVVYIDFDPDIISYSEILEIFFHVHDPTTPNRQGADVGPQYRSVIFYHSEEQRDTAQSVISEIDSSGLWDREVVTEVSKFEAFYEAESYHQDYFERNPGKAYCRVVIAPKVEKLEDEFGEKTEG